MKQAAISNYNFTEREIEVIELLKEGYSNPQIAHKLFISIHTAKAHVCSIIHKMEVQDRTHAIIKLIQSDFTQKAKV